MREKPMKLYHQNLWIQDFCSHVFPIIAIRFFIFAFKSRVHLWIDSCLHNYTIDHFRYSDLFSLLIFFFFISVELLHYLQLFSKALPSWCLNLFWCLLLLFFFLLKLYKWYTLIFKHGNQKLNNDLLINDVKKR